MRIHSSVLLLSGLLVGCGDSPVSDGQLTFCSTASPEMEETGVALAGVVSALNDGSVECSESVTLVGEDDAVLTVGFTVLDENGDDVTPALDLAVDDTVEGIYRYKMVWGTVEGLVLSDADGLVLAADQGTWGGSLEEGDIDFAVSRGAEVLDTEVTECVTTERHGVVFEADETVEVAPFGQGEIAVGGQSLAAWAVSSTVLGPGRNCEISDQTDSLAWAVVR